MRNFTPKQYTILFPVHIRIYSTHFYPKLAQWDIKHLPMSKHGNKVPALTN